MFSTPEDFMRLAVNMAKDGIKKGQTPFGAVVVKDKKVIAKAYNLVWDTTDITAHAEIAAIRQACKKLNTIDLSGADIYSTCEPCPMCFSAIHWANIDTIYYGASIEDAAEAGFHEMHIANSTMKELGGSNVKIVSDILKEESKALFTKWKELNLSSIY
jgi:tRNA(Arg) A34 adenosine deaminase TadA